MGDEAFDHYNEHEMEEGVGFSDATLLLVSVLGFALMAFSVYGIIIRKVKSVEELKKGGDDDEIDYEEELLKADVSTLNRSQRRARAKALMKRQRRVDATGTTNEGEGEDADDDHINSQLSRKERNKNAKAKEKRERHILDEKRRKGQKEAMQLAQEEKKKRLELEAERAQKEKLRRQEEQEEKKKQELQQWRNFLGDGDASISVEEWVRELKEGPTAVPLCELTSRFGVSIDCVKERIQDLIEAGRVAGVLDDEREAFFAFSHEQLLSLASLVETKGEISLEDFSNCTRELLKAGSTQ